MVQINNQLIGNKKIIAIIHYKKITVRNFKKNILMTRSKIEFNITEIINKITTGRKTLSTIKIILIIQIINLII